MTDEKTNLENAVKKEILIVDDGETNRILLNSLLEYDYDIREACNGKQAYEEIEKKMPDLVITDMEMPDENDGLNLIKKIKENDKYKDIKIIAISGSLEKYESRLLEYIEARDMLAKPFGINDLRDTVKRKIYNSH